MDKALSLMFIFGVVLMLVLFVIFFLYVLNVYKKNQKKLKTKKEGNKDALQ